MIWNKKDIDSSLVKEIAKDFDLDVLAASILVRRGVTKPEDLRFFLEEDLRFLHNPFEFRDMEDVVERIYTAKDEGERVMIFGDRDVDGMTSTVLLYEALISLGIEVSWRLPKGDDPYGLTLEAVEEFAANQGTLIITVDCGISNLEEIKRAKELGIDTLVIDHHLPGEALPQALAIINPKIEDSPYPYRDLAGCGVVSKVVWALKFAETELYNHPFCLLNIRPLNDSYSIEAVKVMNLRRVDELRLVIVPGVGNPVQMGLLDFLRDQHILVYQGEPQQRMLQEVFGKAYDINFLDLAEKVSEVFPSLAGKSLLRMKSISRMARYEKDKNEEIDVFFSIFITYMLRQESVLKTAMTQMLDLVALGTLADLMELKNENRILVRQGLQCLANTQRPGLRGLLRKLKLYGKRLGASDVAWQVSPLINSTGRMGQPEKAVELFLCQDEGEIDRLVDEISNMNKERRALGDTAWKKVFPMGKDSFSEHGEKFAFVYDDQIPRGITGILAARLVQKLGVPSLVSTSQGSHIVGSLRTNRNFDTMGFLKSCSDLFIDYGGHDAAAGFSMKAENLRAFQDKLAKEAGNFKLDDIGEEAIEIDAELPASYFSPELINIVDSLEPYGEGHKALTFVIRDAYIESIDLIGKGEKSHVKMLLRHGKFKWPALFWNAADQVGTKLQIDHSIDVAFQLGRNNYFQQEALQLTVVDVKSKAV